MKLVMVFLVLSLVVLMAEPGECFFKHITNLFSGFKAAIKGAKAGWKAHRAAERLKNQQAESGETPPPNPT